MARLLRAHPSYNELVEFIMSEDLDLASPKAVPFVIDAGGSAAPVCSVAAVTVSDGAAALSEATLNGAPVTDGAVVSAENHSALPFARDGAVAPASADASPLESAAPFVFVPQAPPALDAAPVAESPGVAADATASALSVDANTGSENATSAAASGAHTSSASSSSSSSSSVAMPRLRTESRDHALATRAHDRALARRFLDDSASQMTILGLVDVQQHLPEGGLAALFHNNHFSCLTKHNSELYELVTDVRIVDEQPLLVWTKLAQVDNDSLFLDAYFRFPLPHAVTVAFEFCAQRRAAHAQQMQAHLDVHGYLPPDNFYWAHVYCPEYVRREQERLAAESAVRASGGGGAGAGSGAGSGSGNGGGPLAGMQARSEARPAAPPPIIDQKILQARVMAMYEEQERVMHERDQYQREMELRRQREKEKDDGCVLS